MLSQAGAAHNDQSDDDVFLSRKAAQSIFLHINHSGCRTTHVCEQRDRYLLALEQTRITVILETPARRAVSAAIFH
jgi:hypothetical protein